MLFLLFQIFLLMVLAAVCGAALAWWWFNRNYEDVTAYHEELVGKAKAAPAPVTKDDLASSLAGIPSPDLSGVTERLARIESALTMTGSTGLGALNDRFTQVQEILTQTRETGLGGIENRLGRVETLLQQPDDSLEAVLGRLSDIESSLLSVSNEIGRLQNTDLDPVESRLARLEEAVRSQTVPEPDLGPIHAGLARLELAIENLEFPATDVEPLRTHLAAMEARLAEFADRLDTARKADLEELMIRMSTLSSSLAGLRVPDLDSVKERLARMEEAIGAIEVPEQDLTPIVTELRNIESMLRAPSEEMRTVLTKLADIEGGSAAMHSKLSGVEHTVGMLARSGVDLTPVQNRLSGVESALSALRVELQSLPDLAPVERRIAALQESVLALREPDLSPVLSSMRKLDARLDMGAIDGRLASIEYTLAALNHALRARDFGQGVAEGAYAYRQPAQSPTRPEPPAFAPIDKVIPEPAGVRTPRAPSRQKPADTAEDAIAIARRPGDKANLLVDAAFGKEDDLEAINGIGPMLCELLNEIGVYYYWQIADWGPDEIAWVDEKLEHFKGRIERDDWVGQARELARLPTSARRPGAK